LGFSLAAEAARAERLPDHARREQAGQIEVIDVRDWDIAARGGGNELPELWLTLEELALAESYAGLRVATDLSSLSEAASSRLGVASALEGAQPRALAARRVELGVAQRDLDPVRRAVIDEANLAIRDRLAVDLHARDPA
jgi:hypothetical protein